MMCFYECRGLLSETLLAALTRLDSSVFDGCTNLAEVVLAADSRLVYIGRYAFGGDGSIAGKLNLPATITSIDTGELFMNVLFGILL
jgi:hypothetical protein